ncbi:VOC family protein [Arenibacter sp. M-2]|uniref:VOC family protein n=1 Tax=unclassified Arenibacter TaxID=2615047 RepID=UPI000D765C77|nr:MULTISPECIES: VOC family protein [unclassified Arenibacter]MDL5511311.1 VOC family protein [Arenibacter sp. M-2]PXX30702.1 catechol 2,3-dioxygenase-like lactoylglutathione lyase family enzyme [Arenibacter sp. ARW7G5Y1]
MIFEHLALNVKNIEDIKDWYVANLGLKVVFEQTEAPFMTFFEDSSGRVILELYHRPDEEITDFGTKHPLTFHLAFVSPNAEKDKIRLLEKGASFIEEIRKEDGSHLVMLRDPWGMPLQLCHRAKPF